LSELDTLDRQGIANGEIDSQAHLSVETSVITGNVALFTGGGVSNYAILTGTAGIMVRQTTVSSNTAGYGGGFSNIGKGGGAARLVAEQSTLSSNLAWGDGGGVLNGGVGYEDGEACQSGIGLVTLRNTTVSGNDAGGWGGGVANLAGTFYGSPVGPCGTGRVWLEHSTISGNEASVGGGVSNINYYATGGAVLSHSIVSGNDADVGANETYDYCDQPQGLVDRCDGIVANDYNLFGDAGETDYDAFAGTFTPTLGSDIKATSDGRGIPLADIFDPILRDNGGRTKTHALVFGSPAIDAGDPAFSPPPYYDQRGQGYPRVINRRIDIGAYEYRPAPVGGVTVGRRWFGLLVSRARLLLMGLMATLGTFVAALRRTRR
jgi:hypothetical protein